jgi:gliding motility-associated-like protein
MIMKNAIIFIAFLVYAQSVVATDYYVSNSGDDSNPGTSTTSAWKTLDKVNSMMSSFKAGDKILFEKGGIFRGTLKIKVSGSSSNPVIFGAYGSGNNPVLKASKVIGTWSQNGNIWTADCPDCPETVTNLFINNKFQPLGRYPNTGYRTITSAIGSNVIIDGNLSFPDAYWNNAEVAVKTADWVIDVVPISSQVGTTLNLAENTTYGIKKGYGYFFQNHINTLDSEGEWCYDKQQKKIFVYSSDNLNSKSIEIAFYDYCVDITGYNYITVENLELTHSRLASLFTSNCNFITVINNLVRHSGGNGIEIRQTNNAFIDNNTLLNTNNNGFECYKSNLGIFSNNTVIKTSQIPGRGYSGNEKGLGVFLLASNDFLIEYNKVDSTGYNGIHFLSTENAIVKNNFVNHSCLVKSDGGGIYVWGNKLPGNKITGNIVLNSIGNTEGTDQPQKAANGIYIDGYNSGHTVENNTSAFNSTGVFVSHSTSINIKNNTCFDNTMSLFLWASGDYVVDNCIIRNNYFFSLGRTDQWVMYFDDVGGINTFENNTLCDPFGPQIIRDITREGTKIVHDYTFNEWQNQGHITDKAIPFTYAQSGLPDTTGFIKFYINPSKTTKTINLVGTYRDLDNNIVMGSVDINPYSSIILLKENRTILGSETTPTGQNQFCQATDATTYTTVGTSQADTYLWNISPTSAGSLTQNGKSVTVNWNPLFSGNCNLSYLASGPGNYAAMSPPLAIQLAPLPNIPDSPVGIDSLFQNSIPTDYGTSEMEDAISYEWKITPQFAGTIEPKGNGSSCKVTWNEPFFGTAYLSVRGINACGAGNYSDSLKIKVLEAELGYGIINIFTPNGDGFNDYWNIPFIRDFPNATIKIFDRSNKLLIEYKGDESSWNGTVKGELVPMGNYLYVIDLGGGKKPIKGYVTVLR